MKFTVNNSDNTSQPFKTPEDYFSTLENSILSKTLEKKKQSNPFKTPDSYFEQLEDSIISQTSKEKNADKGKIIPLYSGKFYWFSAAACLIFAVMAGIYLIPNNTTQNDSTLLGVNKAEKTDLVTDKLYTADSTQTIADDTATPAPSGFYSSRAGQSSKTRNTMRKQPVPPRESTRQSLEKSSEVLFSLYFDSEEDTPLDDEEEEFLFL
ncbi:MAG: hypothetical protein LBP34_09000 [Flavobacteriaceae bacterium]|jgi:hypothetical protein|nr:hypothetical protein [Flavobacteriaceae bacterium]